MTKTTQIFVKNDGGKNMDGLNTRRIHLREISGDSESPLETVGHDLRAARLRRGDEIAQVSRALKIRKDHLEALENDRIEDLPGKTYAIGFVRSYARHLGLDSDRYVERIGQVTAEQLQAVVSQRLLPRKDGKGRVLAAEVMVVTGTIRDCIVDPERTEEIREHIAEGRVTYGMQTFDQCLMELVQNDLVEYEVAKAAATNAGDFELKMNMLSSRSGAMSTSYY